MRLLAVYGAYSLLTPLLYLGVFWSDDNPQTHYGVRVVSLALSYIVVWWVMRKTFKK